VSGIETYRGSIRFRGGGGVYKGDEGRMWKAECRLRALDLRIPLSRCDANIRSVGFALGRAAMRVLPWD
jgi:hypothetical protein